MEVHNCTVGCHQTSDAAVGIVPGCVGRKQWELTPLSFSLMDYSWTTSRQFNGLLSWQCQSVGIMDKRNLVDRHFNWLASLKWGYLCVRSCLCNSDFFFFFFLLPSLRCRQFVEMVNGTDSEVRCFSVRSPKSQDSYPGSPNMSPRHGATNAHLHSTGNKRTPHIFSYFKYFLWTMHLGESHGKMSMCHPRI